MASSRTRLKEYQLFGRKVRLLKRCGMHGLSVLTYAERGIIVTAYAWDIGRRDGVVRAYTALSNSFFNGFVFLYPKARGLEWDFVD